MGKKKRSGVDKAARMDLTATAFKYYWTGSLSSNLANLTSGGLLAADVRLAEMFDSWSNYRFKQLKVTLFPTSTAEISVSFIALAASASVGPSSIVENLSQPHSLFNSSTMTVPVKMKLNYGHIKGRQAWYGTEQSVDLQQFQLYIRGAGATDVFRIVIEGICEFKDPKEESIAMRESRIRAKILEEMKSSLIVPLPLK